MLYKKLTLFSFAGMLCSLGIMKAQKITVSTGTMQRLESFPSKYIDARNIDIWLPKGYSNKVKYAVLYMHDGQMLFDPTSTWNKQAWKVDEVAGKLIEEQKTKPFIIVGIWNNSPNRHPEYFPQKVYKTLSKEEKDFTTKKLIEKARIKSEFQPVSDNYLKFIVNEVKPYIDSHFSTYTDVSNTYIAGSSMGGLISLYALCEYPNVFGGAACLSTHWTGIYQLENNSIPEHINDYLKNNLPSPKNHKIYFDHGDQTLDALYPTLQDKIDIIMKNKGYDTNNWMSKTFHGKDHSENAWHDRFDIPLLFLLKK